jgi:ketosteroid isomerase-like protein
MSSTDVEIVRRGFETFRGGVDAALEVIDPEFEMVTTAQYAAEPDTYRGHDGIRRWFDGFDGAMDRIWLEPRELEDLGSNRVLATFALHATGISTGLETELEALAIVTLRGERILRIEFFPDAESARAAVKEG